MTKKKDKITESLVEALRQVFGENTKAKRFVDVSRIPLICKSILDMHENIKEINDKLDNKFITKETFQPIEEVVKSTTDLASNTLVNYKVDRARIWTAIAVITFLGGTIITLAIMQIDNKIKDDVTTSVSDILSTYNISSQ